MQGRDMYGDINQNKSDLLLFKEYLSFFKRRYISILSTSINSTWVWFICYIRINKIKHIWVGHCIPCLTRSLDVNCYKSLKINLQEREK
jgi:hypothetical protein